MIIKLKGQKNIGIILIISSLFLLFLFLAYWIFDNYKEQKKILQQELGFLFMQSERKVEGHFVAKMFPNLPIPPNQNAEIEHFQEINDTNQKDKMMFIRQEKMSIISGNQDKKDTNRNMKIVVLPMKKQTITEIVVNDSGQKDSLFNKKISKIEEARLEMPSEIKDTFALLFQRANLPIKFQFISDTNANNSNRFLLKKNRNEGLYGTTLNVEIIDYQSYIIKKILPQIIFGLFLFSAVSLSFWLLYSNWKAQQKMIELKNDLISNITHELKTPISTVSVAIEALSDFNAIQDPIKSKEYLQLSKLELNRLSLLVDKVLKMSLFEQKVQHLDVENIDLNLLVQNVIDSMKLQFEKYRAKVVFESEEIVFLKGDKIHLSNVIYNLLDNALKYSSSDVAININLKKNGKEILLKIQDNGIGVSAEYHKRIFEKFFRVPTGDIHNVKGYGLGLSYVLAVVKQHGGKIRFESEIGKGSTFYITF